MATIAPPARAPSKGVSIRERVYPYAYPLGAGLVVLGGVLPRVDRIAQSLWAAESWVADSVLADGLRGMFYYDKWLQTTPPLFLLLVRGCVRIFGLSDYSLRAVPFGLSVLALILMAILAKKMFSAPFAILCTFLVALSPPAIVYAKELKQYSADLAASCLILLVLWNYVQCSNRSRYARLLLVFGTTLFLSYTSVVFVPLTLVVLALATSDQSPPLTLADRVARIGAFSLVASAPSGLNYLLFIRPNSSPALTDFWGHGFPPVTHISDLPHFYIENFLAMAVYFYFPAQSTTKDSLKSLILSLPIIIHLLALAIVIIMTVVLIRAIRKRRPYKYVVLFFFVPLMTFAGLNLMRMYPVGSRRLTLFLLPCVALVTTASLEALWQTLSPIMFSRVTGQRVLVGAATFCMLGALVLGYRAAGWDLDLTQAEDTESAFRYLKSHVQPSDILYVHASVEESARLYSKMLRWDNPAIRYGNTGWPCCTRTLEPRPQAPALLRSYIVQDFDHVTAGRTAGFLWLVFTGRAEHWNYLGVDESAIISDRLFESGCRKELEQLFDNEVTMKFSCTARARVVPASGASRP